MEPQKESLIPGCHFSGSMFDFWGGYLHAHPFVHFGLWTYPPGDSKAACVSWPWRKRCVSQICLEKVQKFIHFLPPSKKKIGVVLRSPNSSPEALLWDLQSLWSWCPPRAGTPPEESQRMHVETSACVWYPVYNADYSWLRVDMYSTKNAIYLMITEIFAKHCLNSLLVPNYSHISSISVLPRFFLPATLRTSAPPVLPPTKCTSPTPNPDPFEAEQEQTSHRSGDQTNSDDMTWQLLGMSRLEAGRNS